MLIVEDDWLAGRDARAILERHGFVVVGIASDLAQARSHFASSLDVAVLDIGLVSEGDGIQLGEQLSDLGIPIVYVSGCTDPAVLARAGATVPRGFLAKPYSEGQLVSAVRVALAPLPTPNGKDHRQAIERIAQVLVELGVVPAGVKASEPRADLPELSALSSREWEVVRALLSHERVPQIAKRLHISQSTVRNHLKSIYGKLGVHSQQELIGRLL